MNLPPLHIPKANMARRGLAHFRNYEAIILDITTIDEVSQWAWEIPPGKRSARTEQINLTFAVKSFLQTPEWTSDIDRGVLRAIFDQYTLKITKIEGTTPPREIIRLDQRLRNRAPNFVRSTYLMDKGNKEVQRLLNLNITVDDLDKVESVIRALRDGLIQDPIPIHGKPTYPVRELLCRLVPDGSVAILDDTGEGNLTIFI